MKRLLFSLLTLGRHPRTTLLFGELKNGTFYKQGEKVFVCYDGALDKKKLSKFGVYFPIESLTMITSKRECALSKKPKKCRKEIYMTNHSRLRKWERSFPALELQKLIRFLRNFQYPFNERTAVIFRKDFLNRSFKYSRRRFKRDWCFIIESQGIKTMFSVAGSTDSYIASKWTKQHFIIFK